MHKSKKKNGNIYIVQNSLINHTGGISKKQDLEYLRNWHWMWSKFYFNKKHYGFYSIFKIFLIFFHPHLNLYFIRLFLIIIKKIYQMRVSGLVNSILGNKSFLRLNN